MRAKITKKEYEEMNAGMIHLEFSDSGINPSTRTANGWSVFLMSGGNARGKFFLSKASYNYSQEHRIPIAWD